MRITLAFALLSSLLLVPVALAPVALAPVALAQDSTDRTWQLFQLEKLSKKRRNLSRPYLGYLKTDALTAGLYVLPKGGKDKQEPHEEDEVYYVLKGSALFESGGETKKVIPGSIIYVKAGAPHRFKDIGETLELLVFFSNWRDSK